SEEGDEERVPQRITHFPHPIHPSPTYARHDAI
ncbi:hypothetical protein ADUPG1_014074, partial [Aduncisulcus paluster]